MQKADDIPLERLAATALANVATDYPFHLTHLAHGDDEVLPPHRRAVPPSRRPSCSN
jgi:hypothetical protein